MKKLSVLLFSALLLTSFCFAAETPVTDATTQAKVTENKKEDALKKSVKPKIKKVKKKVKKVDESVKQ